MTVSDESVNLMKESGIESLKVNFEDDLAVVMPLDQEPVSMEKGVL